MSGDFCMYLFVRSDFCLSSGQTGYRNTIGRAGNIIKSCILEELNGDWISAMFAAYAQFDVGAGFSCPPASHLYQLADTYLVQLGCWVKLKNSVFEIVVQNLTGVIS